MPKIGRSVDGLASGALASGAGGLRGAGVSGDAAPAPFQEVGKVLLDTDAISEMMADAFDGIFGEGVLRKISLVDVGGGSLEEISVEYPIRIQIDACTEAMRMAAGYTGRDASLIILRSGVEIEELTSDDKIITADGREWRIYEVGTDPARSHWIGRGVQSNAG